MKNYKTKYKVTYDKTTIQNGYKPKSSKFVVIVKRYTWKTWCLAISTVFVVSLGWCVTKFLEGNFPKKPPVQQPKIQLINTNKPRK